MVVGLGESSPRNKQAGERTSKRTTGMQIDPWPFASLSLIFFSPPSFSQLFYLVSFFLFSFLLLSHSKFYPFEKREGGVELFGFWPAYC